MSCKHSQLMDYEKRIGIIITARDQRHTVRWSQHLHRGNNIYKYYVMDRYGIGIRLGPCSSLSRHRERWRDKAMMQWRWSDGAMTRHCDDDDAITRWSDSDLASMVRYWTIWPYTDSKGKSFHQMIPVGFWILVLPLRTPINNKKDLYG